MTKEQLGLDLLDLVYLRTVQGKIKWRDEDCTEYNGLKLYVSPCVFTISQPSTLWKSYSSVLIVSTNDDDDEVSIKLKDITNVIKQKRLALKKKGELSLLKKAIKKFGGFSYGNHKESN